MLPTARGGNQIEPPGDAIRQNRQIVPLLFNEFRIRDVRVGPDGLIYLATDNRFGNPTAIVRLVPEDD